MHLKNLLELLNEIFSLPCNTISAQRPSDPIIIFILNINVQIIKYGRSHLIWTEVKVQPSGRLEESEVGVGGLHFGWIFLCLLQLVSNLITVLFQASI